MSWRMRWLAGQFRRPSGLIGRRLIGPWLDRISRRANRIVLERLAPARGDRVLEIGFGGGDLLGLILGTDPAQLVAVDRSEAMVARAQARFHGAIRDGRLAVVIASAEALPLSRGAVDKAVSVHSLYFWPDLGKALGELARVVRPGGKLVLGFDAPAKVRRWRGHRYGFAVYEAHDVIAGAEAAGFREARLDDEDGLLCLSLERRADMGRL